MQQLVYVNDPSTALKGRHSPSVVLRTGMAFKQALCPKCKVTIKGHLIVLDLHVCQR